MKKWLVIPVVILLTLLPSTLVFAATSADVTITATGVVVWMPTGFMLTYINDHEVRIDWVKGIGADKTMVRGAVGRVPTSRTDGYLVYYDTGVTAFDTGVSLDETAAYVYYRAWSQDAAGTWENIGVWDFIQGVGMTLIALILLCVALSVMALWKPNYVLAIISGASWVSLFAYTRANPLPGIAVGDNFDTFFLIICLGAAIALPAYIIFKARSNHENIDQLEFSSEPSYRGGARQTASDSVRQSRSVRHGWGKDYADTAEDYQARIHSILHPKRSRR